MRIDRLTADQALASLKSSLAGLAQTEAARRLLEFGPNHVEELALGAEKPDPAVMRRPPRARGGANLSGRCDDGRCRPEVNWAT
jgi:hypothetical protein